MLGQDAHRELREPGAQREQEQGGRNVEEGVHVGDLGRRAAGGQRLDKLRERERHADHGEDARPDQVEEQVDDGGALRVAPGADRGQHRGDAGADVLAEEDVNRARQADEPAVRQRLEDPHRR